MRWFNISLILRWFSFHWFCVDFWPCSCCLVGLFEVPLRVCQCMDGRMDCKQPKLDATADGWFRPSPTVLWGISEGGELVGKTKIKLEWWGAFGTVSRAFISRVLVFLDFRLVAARQVVGGLQTELFPMIPMRTRLRVGWDARLGSSCCSFRVWWCVRKRRCVGVLLLLLRLFGENKWNTMIGEKGEVTVYRSRCAKESNRTEIAYDFVGCSDLHSNHSRAS